MKFVFNNNSRNNERQSSYLDSLEGKLATLINASSGMLVGRCIWRLKWFEISINYHFYYEILAGKGQFLAGFKLKDG